MDVLSDVLNAVRLTGAVYFEIGARAPWVAATPHVEQIRERVMPGFEHVIAFHVLLEGACFAQLADESEPPVLLEAGDAIVFASGDAHFMASDLHQRAQPDLDMYRRPLDRPLPFTMDELGGTGAPARLACGYLGCDARPFNPILGALPRALHVRRQNEYETLLHELIRAALRESERPRPGGETFLAKLGELVFLQAVRQHVDGLEPEARGWLAGLRDRHIGAALRLMHARAREPWTLETLAREVGLSRSVFAERFARLMGATPIQYLGNWRLQLAAGLLARETMSVAQAASSVGYDSEAAFNRAFKKQVGMPPGAWRRRRAASVDAIENQRKRRAAERVTLEPRLRSGL